MHVLLTKDENLRYYLLIKDNFRCNKDQIFNLILFYRCEISPVSGGWPLAQQIIYINIEYTKTWRHRQICLFSWETTWLLLYVLKFWSPWLNCKYTKSKLAANPLFKKKYFFGSNMVDELCRFFKKWRCVSRYHTYLQYVAYR